MASLVGMTLSTQTGYSVLLGAGTSVLPSAVFVWTVFATSLEASPRALVRGFYRAELVKLLFSAALFAAVFALVEQVQLVTLLLGFVVVHLSGAFAGVGIPDGSQERLGKG